MDSVSLTETITLIVIHTTINMILLMDTPHITIFPLSFPASPKALALHLPPRARRQRRRERQRQEHKLQCLQIDPLAPSSLSLHGAGWGSDTQT